MVPDLCGVYLQNGLVHGYKSSMEKTLVLSADVIGVFATMVRNEVEERC